MSSAIKDGRPHEKVANAFSEGLLRPEPKSDDPESAQGSFALLGLALAALALIIIYLSAPVDSPEWPDCPIQSLGSCGEQ